MHKNSSYVGPLEDEVHGPTPNVSSPEIAPEPDEFGRKMIELVANVRAGRQESIAELYALIRRLAGALFVTLGSAEAEDRIHDAFLIVERAIRLDKVRKPASIGGIIKVILRRQRYRAIEEMRGRVPIDKLAARANNDDLIHQVLREQRLAVVQTSLQRLSDRDREILVRFYVNEEHPDAICSALHLSASQFRLRKSNAKARLVRASQRYLRSRRLKSTVRPLVSWAAK